MLKGGGNSGAADPELQPGSALAADPELQPGPALAADPELQPGPSLAADPELQPGPSHIPDIATGYQYLLQSQAKDESPAVWLLARLPGID